MDEESNYSNQKTIVIRTTEAGSCHRKRQHYIRGVKTSYGAIIEPLPSHFTPTRGNLIHEHIKNFIDSNGDYKPDPWIPTNFIESYQLDSDMLPYFEADLKAGWKVFLTWVKKTDVNFTPDNLIGTEHQILMPLTPPKENFGFNYVQRVDMDLITKGDIVDFKRGKKAYLGKYKWQLGSYRRAAKYAQLDKLVPSGDFRLLNVFLGDEEEPEQQVHDPKKISDSMMNFDTAMVETMEQDALIRGDLKYNAPCSVDMFCGFCGWRHVCRGV